MYFDSQLEKECCGCGACADACPKNCISLEVGRNNFLFPTINLDMCIECNRCREVCPINNIVELKAKHEHSAWFVMASDSAYRKASASGGAFGKIAEAAASENRDGIRIWGAAFDDDFKVHHICVESVDKLTAIRNSKYLQSVTQDVFKQVAEQLREGLFVVFSGTPCQIAALRCYLSLFKNIDTDNLLTTDLVCHGVPSQHMFDMYLAEAEQVCGSKLCQVEFRFKETQPGEASNSRRMRLSFADGSNKIETRESGAYLKMYHGGFGYRESCYNCPYARADRVGDLTLKDAWSVHEYYPEYNVHEGVSLVLSNSEQGDVFIKILQARDDIIVLPVDYDEFISKVKGGALANPTPCPDRNREFMDCAEQIGFTTAVERYCSLSFTQRAKRFVKRVLRQ